MDSQFQALDYWLNKLLCRRTVSLLSGWYFLGVQKWIYSMNLTVFEGFWADGEAHCSCPISLSA
jgi:hypothetical protein